MHLRCASGRCRLATWATYDSRTTNGALRPLTVIYGSDIDAQLSTAIMICECLSSSLPVANACQVSRTITTAIVRRNTLAYTPATAAFVWIKDGSFGWSYAGEPEGAAATELDNGLAFAPLKVRYPGRNH